MLPSGVLAHCGGANRLANHFAANLLRDDLSEKEIEAISRSLILSNGVRKTTNANRNCDALRGLLQDGTFRFVEPIRVLDIGASFGLDASSNYRLLADNLPVAEYVLGDLHNELLFDEARQLIFDQDGNLLQVLRNGYFVNINFEYKFWYQKWVNIPKRLYPALLRRQYHFDPRTATSIKLVDPRLRVGQPDSPFAAKRMSVFDALDENFDLIICFHLVTSRYFSERECRVAKQHLLDALNPGGALIIGETENYSMVRRNSDGSVVSTDFGSAR